MRDAVGPAAVRALLELQNRSSLTYTWVRYVNSHVSDPFFLPVQQTLLSQLKSMQIIRSAGGARCLPANVLSVPSSYRAADGQPLVPEQYVSPKRYLAPQYDLGRDGHTLKVLGVTEMSPTEFIDGLSKMETDGSLHAQSDVWWESVCGVLRGMHYYNRHAIRALKIVPLTGGGWTSANAGVVYFDSTVADIPQDLGMMLVKRLGPFSERRRLLEQLDVKEADYTEVAKQIHYLHESNSRSRSSRFLVSHAHFLFNHRYEIEFSCSLYVLSKDGAVIAAKDAYMDHPAFSSPKLSSVLDSPTAHFLHPDYDVQPNSAFSHSTSWKDWLRDQLCVNVAPKYNSFTLSVEFIEFLDSATTQEKLAYIKQYRDTIHGVIQYPSAAKFVRETQVTTSDGVERALCTTYLKRDVLERFSDLPFLPISDPKDATWDVLTLLGVSCHVNFLFYLKELTRYSERATHGNPGSTLNMARDFYKQLEARFRDDGNETAIR